LARIDFAPFFLSFPFSPLVLRTSTAVKENPIYLASGFSPLPPPSVSSAPARCWRTFSPPPPSSSIFLDKVLSVTPPIRCDDLYSPVLPLLVCHTPSASTDPLLFPLFFSFFLFPFPPPVSQNIRAINGSMIWREFCFFSSPPMMPSENASGSVCCFSPFPFFPLIVNLTGRTRGKAVTYCGTVLPGFFLFFPPSFVKRIDAEAQDCTSATLPPFPLFLPSPSAG